MKLPFKVTPGRSMAFAFWCGWAFHMGSDLVVESVLQSDWVMVAIISVLCFIPLIIYSRNKVKFDREHMWMMIKNPAKVTVEDHKATQAGQGAGRPIRPPPPPMPPVKPARKPKTII